MSGRFALGRVVTALYALLPVVWCIARQTPVARWWLFELTDIFSVWMYLPLPLLAALAALRRDRSLTAWLVLPLAMFLVEYGGAFLPKRVAVAAAGTPLRVMTSNLMVDNQYPAGLEAVLEQENPDVVALQELNFRMANFLNARLRDRYPYQVLHPHVTDGGLGVLSRYPIQEVGPPGLEPGTCLCQHVRIDLGSEVVDLLSVHPDTPRVRFLTYKPVPLPRDFNDSSRDAEITMALARVADATGPLLVVGDFNTSDRQPFYRRLRERLDNAYEEAGWGFGYTYPTFIEFFTFPFPLVRIDHVFYNQAWAARAAWSAALPGSDHRYLIADLLLR
jgi:vancomycin resistance protein VanJ